MNQSYKHKPITNVSYLITLINFMIGVWFLIPLFLIRPVKKIYLAPLSTSRIGHFILDSEVLLARIYNEHKNNKNKIIVLWFSESFVTNKYVYSIWKKKFRILPYNIITSIILSAAITFEKLTKIKITYRFNGFDELYRYFHLLETSPTVFDITESDEKECSEILRTLGIDITKQWVCIMARDNDYLEHAFPNKNYDFNSYRNSDIETYMSAAEYLASKNIITFRMGTDTAKPFISNNSDLVIDYANSGWRTEKLDIFLAMKCLFFISSGTGLDAVPAATRSPLLFVNYALPLQLYRSKQNHIVIFKKFFHQKENTFLSIRKYYELGIKSGFTVDNPFHLRDQDLRKLKVDVIDNTSFEILDATIEMYTSLTNKKSRINKLNKFQLDFWEKFPEIGLTSNSNSTQCRIGAKFLSQNKWILG